MRKAFGLVFLLAVACGTLRGAGEDMKKAAPWIPEPYGTVADVVGTALVMFAGHKTVRHVQRRRAVTRAASARSTAGHGRLAAPEAPPVLPPG